MHGTAVLSEGIQYSLRALLAPVEESGSRFPLELAALVDVRDPDGDRLLRLLVGCVYIFSSWGLFHLPTDR